MDIIKIDTTDYISYHDSHLKRILRDFVSEYELNKSQIDPLINNSFIFNHILHSIKMSFEISKKVPSGVKTEIKSFLITI